MTFDARALHEEFVRKVPAGRDSTLDLLELRDSLVGSGLLNGGELIAQSLQFLRALPILLYPTPNIGDNIRKLLSGSGATSNLIEVIFDVLNVIKVQVSSRKLGRIGLNLPDDLGLREQL